MKNTLIVSLLVAWATPLLAELPDLSVTKADKQAIKLPAGTNKGLKAGMWLDVFRQEEPIVHPVTGEVLGAPRVKIAEVQVTRAFKTTALAKITMSYAPIAPGDIVRESGSVPMEPSESAAAKSPAARPGPRAGSEETARSAERLAWEITEIRANISSLSKALGRIAGIERTVAKMEGNLGSMQSAVSSLKQEMAALKEKSGAPQLVSISRENLAEFKVKHSNLNVAVRSGAEPLLIPVEAFAQILLPYVKEGQEAAVDSLVKSRLAEGKAAVARPEAGHGEVEAEHAAEAGHPVGQASPGAPSAGEDPMAELQRLMDESKSKPAWRIYLETYWPFGAGIGVFLGLVIVVVKLVRRKKVEADDEEGILDLEEEGPVPESDAGGEGEVEEETKQEEEQK